MHWVEEVVDRISRGFDRSIESFVKDTPMYRPKHCICMITKFIFTFKHEKVTSKNNGIFGNTPDIKISGAWATANDNQRTMLLVRKRTTGRVR